MRCPRAGNKTGKGAKGNTWIGLKRKEGDEEKKEGEERKTRGEKWKEIMKGIR